MLGVVREGEGGGVAGLGEEGIFWKVEKTEGGGGRAGSVCGGIWEEAAGAGLTVALLSGDAVLLRKVLSGH